jgi:hypothetical protein
MGALIHVARNISKQQSWIVALRIWYDALHWTVQSDARSKGKMGTGSVSIRPTRSRFPLDVGLKQ